MGWTPVNPVAIGNATKKDDYDALWDNAVYLHDTVNAPTGTIMLFGNNAAPTAWTRKTDWQDAAMLVYRASGGLSSGGASSVRDAHSHTVSGLNANSESNHTHTISETGAASAIHSHTVGTGAIVSGTHTHTGTHTHADSGDLVHTHRHQIFESEGISVSDYVWINGGVRTQLTTGHITSASGSNCFASEGNSYPACRNDLWTDDYSQNITGASAATDPGISTTGSSHSHGLSGSVGNASAHTHGAVASGSPSAGHTHTISGTSAAATIKRYQDVLAATRD